MAASIPQASLRSFPGCVGRPLLWRVVTEGRSGECPRAGACPLYWPRSRGGGFRRPTGLRPGVLHGRPSQAITTGAKMAAGEKRREVGRLSPTSTDVDIGATWAGVVRVVALHRPVQVSLDGLRMSSGLVTIEPSWWRLQADVAWGRALLSIATMREGVEVRPGRAAPPSAAPREEGPTLLQAGRRSGAAAAGRRVDAHS